MEESSTEQQLRESSKKFIEAKKEISKVIVGQNKMIDRLLIALLSNGHILLEGLPGLAKTLAVTTLAKVIQCDFKRIQFTPDLLPADLIGTSIYNPKEGAFSVNKGPIFTNILLADEINRAPAKVQSALLEVMQERQVTISGHSFPVESPYMVLATQNPIEHEGTYPLPEAQTDRFMLKVKLNYPSFEEEEEILKRMGTSRSIPKANTILSIDEILQARKIVDNIYVDKKITSYILNIIFATRNPERFKVPIDNLLLFGASPRASLALIQASKAHAFLSEQAYVTPYHVKEMAYDVLRHRLRRTYEAEAENISTDEIISRILSHIPEP